MFIRETIKKVKNKEYKQYKLIESIRTPHGPRQRILFDLGRFNLEKEKWKLLANAIEDKLKGTKNLFELYDEEIEKLSEHYSNVIVMNQLNKKTENEENTEEIEYKQVDIKSLNSSDARTIGSEHVALSQMEDYKINNILKEIGFNNKEIEYIKMLIAGRMIHPGSERETARWIRTNSAIRELIKTNNKVYDTVLHNVAIKILNKKEEIEDKLIKAARERFNLEETVILYDLTNTYYEGSKRKSKIAQYGKSKEKRNDAKLITLALSIDEEGFPKWSKILEGNVGESKTLEGMLETIETKGIKDKERFEKMKTVVIDAGIASQENLNIIKAKGYKYIAVSRKGIIADNNNSTEKEIELSYTDERLKIQLIKQEEEIYCICHSKEKERRDKDIWETKSKKFETILKKMQENLKKKRLANRYDKVIERIGRIKERYHIGYYYDINIKEESGIVTEIEYKKNEKAEINESKFGKYTLRTNRTDLNEEQISKIHRSLTRIEDSFRYMKSELGMRPIYHKNDNNSIAHIFITVIAYHIISGILKKLRDKGINYTWNSIRNILSTHIRITTSFNIKDEGKINIRNTTTPTIEQKEIYTALEILHNPLKKITI